MTTALWPALLAPSDQARSDLQLVAAHDHRVRFATGHEALCGTSGLWNVPLGYGNPVIAEAAAEALRSASYLSVFRYTNTYAAAAAAQLVERTAGRYQRVVFTTSGGSANDAVLKLVRHAQALRAHPEKRLVVGLTGSYHGLTYGGFSLTGENLGQQLYGVDPRFVRHVAPNDVDALNALFAAHGAHIAAVVVEPVLGTGTVPLSPDYVAALGALRDHWGAFVVADEVATGFGRTGPLFASAGWPFAPDVLVTSKGLTNGTSAAAALLVGAEVAGLFNRHDQVFVHAETQAGTPVSCATMTATMAEFDRLGALESGARVALELDEALTALCRRLPVPSRLAGSGLFRTLHLDPGGSALTAPQLAALIELTRCEGAVVHPGPGGVQLIPALTYAPAEVQELTACVERAVQHLSAHDWNPAAALAPVRRAS